MSSEFSVSVQILLHLALLNVLLAPGLLRSTQNYLPLTRHQIVRSPKFAAQQHTLENLYLLLRRFAPTLSLETLVSPTH